jgi:hypothetical protein
MIYQTTHKENLLLSTVNYVLRKLKILGQNFQRSMEISAYNRILIQYSTYLTKDQIANIEKNIKNLEENN